MKNERVIGFVLLFFGLSLICVSVYLAIGVFTGTANPPDIFRVESIILAVPTQAASPVSLELLKGEVLSRVFNMAAWYILMLFIVSAGGKIAGIGVQLLKEIKVIVKGNDSI